MNTSIEKEQLKEVIKESLSEVFEQKRDFFVQVFGEIIEDRLFLEAIKDGESSGSVERDEVFSTLRS